MSLDFEDDTLIGIRLVSVKYGKRNRRKEQYDMQVKFFLLNSETGENIVDSKDNVGPVVKKTFLPETERFLTQNWNQKFVFPSWKFKFLGCQDVKAVLLLEIKESKSKRGEVFPIGWAFLFPRVRSHLNSEVPLQCYHIPKAYQEIEEGVPKVFHLWRRGPWIKEEMVLSLVLQPVLPRSHQPSNSPLKPGIPQNPGSHDGGEEEAIQATGSPTRSESTTVSSHDLVLGSKWTRLPGQAAKSPNANLLSLSSGKGGCMCVKFSLDGTLLAAAVRMARNQCHIRLFSIPGGEDLGSLSHHTGPIHQLTWVAEELLSAFSERRRKKESPGKKTDEDTIGRSGLLSVSSDGDCVLWSIQLPSKSRRLRAKKVLVYHHPSYTYCAAFQTDAPGSFILATAGFDKVVRLWEDDVMVGELEGPRGIITSLLWVRGNLLIGDGCGTIYLWENPLASDPGSPGVIALPELSGSLINRLILYPGSGRRILVSSRQSALYMIELSTWAVMTVYRGSLCLQEQAVGCGVTPCGTLVVAGSEDGTLHSWDAETGREVGVALQVYPPSTSGMLGINALDLHPLDDLVVVGSWGPNSSISILGCRPSSTETGFGAVGTLLGKPTHSTLSGARGEEEAWKKLLNKVDRLLTFTNPADNESED